MLHLGAVNEFASPARILRLRARQQPEFPTYTFLAGREKKELTLTCAELDARASEIASRLVGLGARPGDRGFLLYPPGLELISALFGCLYAGVVAVPAYPPRRSRQPGGDPRLRALAQDATPRFVLTASSILARARAGTSSELISAAWLATDERTDEAPAGAAPCSSPDPPEPRRDRPALLQYTSGSTAAPKGVIVTHANLVHNEEMIRRAFQQSEASVVVGWLPMYHDMGLIGNVLLPLCVGARCILMAPMDFLQKPRRWLQAIDRYRATTSGGPNFAYELCVRKIPPAERRGLDLSCWSVAFNGAEPVRASTLDRFAEAFAPCGFRRRAFVPCYGLAEATLFVAGGAPAEAPRVESVSAADLLENRVVAAPRGRTGSRDLVSCGRPRMGQQVVIVDPARKRRCAAGRVGEIWVSGASVGQGYWNRPRSTERDFRARLREDPEAGPFLRTGDLGFLNGGELFITGRLKELLVVRGRNHYPQDIELTVERSHPALRPGCGAAFAVEVGEEEHLILVHEVERHFRGRMAEVVDSVRRAVSEEHELHVGEVVLVVPGAVAKTTSGKIRRRACREDFLAGRLREVTARVPRTAAWKGPRAPELAAADLRAAPADERPTRLGPHLRRWAAGALGIAADALDPRQPLSTYGLDSLQAIELRHEVESRLGIELSPSRLLAGANLSDLSAEILAGLAELPAEVPAARVTADSRSRPPVEAALSYGQRALWWVERLVPQSAAHNLVGLARLRGALSRDALRQALRDLVERHPALRATFTARRGEPRQRFFAAEAIPETIPELDLYGFGKSAVGETEAGASGDLLLEAAYRPFDLERGPLLRVGLQSGADGEQRIALTVHHLVADFWSLSLLLGELAVRYSRHRGQAVPPLAPLRIHYADYVRAQTEWLESPPGKAAWRYWRHRLRVEPAPIDLPLDRPRPPVAGHRGDSLRVALSTASSAELEALGRTREATLHMTLLAAFQTLLSRYSGQTDFAVGIPAAGRGSPALAPLMGYLVNPLVMRAELGGDPTFEEFLARVRRGVLEALAHQDYPLALLAERLRPDRDPSRSPFFQVMLVLQQPRRPAEQALAACALGISGSRLRLGDLELESVSFRQRASRFDLTLQMAKIQGRLHAVAQYDRDLFDAVTVRRFLAHFKRLLTALGAAAQSRLSAIELLSAGERQQLLAEWNDTATKPPAVPLLHELLAPRAASAPAAIALVAGERTVSCGELERRAALLAGRLRELGVGPEKRVVVALERCPEMVVAFLAVLKAGGCYVPLDPSFPEPRRAFMLTDCGASVVIARHRLGAAGVVTVDPFAEPGIAAARAGVQSRPGNAAYVIYTSGSTGRPKGVVITHRAIVNRLLFTQRASPLTTRDAVLQSAGSSFDFALWEIFGSLYAGARLILPRPGEAHDPLYLWDLIIDRRVSLAHFVPPMLALFLEAGEKQERQERDTSLRLVFCGGEVLLPTLRDRFFDQLGAVELWNQYGPTEATVDATFERCRPAPSDDRSVAIGRPIANLGTRVLDGRLRPLPAGTRGELYLVGEGLARGYLLRPALTAHRFLPDPFVARPGVRLYCTGDLARYRLGGELEFLGRGDHQIKVRGQRLELGEIETILASHPAVREAAVTAVREGVGDTMPDAALEAVRLVAYAVLEPNRPATSQELRSYLRRRLPGFMVPAVLVLLEALPRTPSGKLDRRALEPPDRARRGLSRDFAAPRNPIEEGLADLWAELLSLERVSIHDDFFALGGHSLLSVRLIFRIREIFAVDLPPVSVFEAPSVEQMARRVVATLRSAPPPQPLRPVPRHRPLRLSYAQERLWFLDRLAPRTALYHLPGVLRLRGALHVAALEAAISEMIRRHESLRTTFRASPDDAALRGEHEGRPVQVVARARRRSLPIVDLSRPDAGRHDRLAFRLAHREAQRPFDLERGPLLRMALLRLDDELHLLWIHLHHIVSDGGSTAVILREISGHYRALVQGRPSPLPEPAIQYADYAHHQRSWLRGELLQEQLGWWRRQLADLPVLALPTDRQRPAVRSGRGDRISFRWREDLCAALAGLRRRQGVTLYTTLLAGFQCLLYRVTHQRDLPVGTPVTQRHRAELEGLIGLFVNTLVLRTHLVGPHSAGEPSFRELLGRVREVVLAAYAHQDLPFEKLVEAHRPERDLGYNPLFQVMFALEYVAPQEGILLPGLTWRRFDLASATAKFDLTLALEHSAAGLCGALEYSRDLFDAATVQRLAGSLRSLFEGAVLNSERRLSELPLLRSGERQQVVVEWNDTRVLASAPAERGEVCLHGLVEAQVRRTPDAVAVDFEGTFLSYGALDLRAADLARRLRQRGVGPETVVGVCAERRAELITAIFGVLKAGAAYLPFDPREPRRRLAGMLLKAGVETVLAPSTWDGAVDVRTLDSDDAGSPPRPFRDAVPVTPDQAAYVIYTSGSTGEPKAAVTTHRAVCQNLLSTRGLAPLSSADRMLVKTPGQFDVSVKEIFWPLISGARLVLARPEGHWDPAYLRAVVDRCAVTTVGFVPAMLEAFLGGLEPGTCRSLRRVTCGSEALSPALAKRFSQHLNAPLLYFYGPTEAAIDVLAWKWDGRLDVVPLGRPLAETRIYLAGPRLEPVGVGVLGEIAIGGGAPARGYLGRPGLSAVRFVPEPFSGAPGARMYLTGDLARWLPDGTCLFQGRGDHQVKIRGYRVELGEIEAILENHPRIERAVVVVGRPVPPEGEGANRRGATGDRRLVAWIVPRPGRSPEVTEVRNFIASRLPDYMVPGLALLDALPLRTGGKIDRAALSRLPWTPGDGGDPATASTAPRTPTETALAALWTELLGAGQVASGSHFFELGGHSLLAIQLVSRVRQRFAVEIPLREVFEAPRLSALALRIDEAARDAGLSDVDPPRPWARPAELPLSFAQQRLWFLDRFDPETPVYHIAAALRLLGGLDKALIERSLAAVVARHEILRTGFGTVDGRPTQVIAESLSLPIPGVDLRALAPLRREGELHRLAHREARQPFDLAVPPLLRLTLLRLADDEHVLLSTMHHIVADAWSMEILLHEIEAYFEAFLGGELPALPELPVQYADYALWQRDWLRGEKLASQVDWWREQLSGAAPVLRLGTDRPQSAVPRFRGGCETLRLTPSLWSALRALGRQHEATPFMTVLAALGILLGRHAGQERFAIGSPIANRRWAELEGLIGFFVNTLALVTDLGGDPTGSEVLERTRTAALGAYGHQDLPFEKLVEELRPERDTGHSPLFQVLFVLRTAPPALTLPGLTLSPIPVKTASAKFALSLLAEEEDLGLRLTLEYDADRFDATTIRRLGKHGHHVLRALAAAPQRRISTLAMLSTGERHQLTAEWNDTAMAHSVAESCLTRMLRAPLEHLGEKVALTFQDQHLSYSDLHRRARRLGRRLEDLGAGPETRVGVLLERSPKMVVGLLGILEAGAAYLPLDPSYPAARLDGMARDAGIRVLLDEVERDGGFVRRILPSYNGPVIPMDDTVADGVVADVADPPPQSAARADNLAYVIYTSGSTGRPNGVGISRRSLASLLRSMGCRPGLGRCDALLAITTLSFDIATLDLFLPLLRGARLELASRETAGDPARLRAQLEISRASVLQATPATWQMLVDSGLKAKPGLVALAGGEALTRELAQRLMPRTAALWNLYGPTEATIYAVGQKIGGQLERIPIGRPVDGTRILLLGRRREVVPTGATGELHIGGVGLARGYLGRPALTAERFLPDASGALPGERLFRTGDLARRRSDGVLECLGRRDHQIKLRGFRLEPGEVEATLVSHPAVREALVRAWETDSGDRRLVAYLGLRGAEPSAGELRRFLAARLPSFMVPASFELLDTLPRTLNGKVDRQALAPPTSARPGSKGSYVAPTTPLEEVLADLWAELLAVDRVGIHDDFFELGGHSLLTVRMLSWVQSFLGVETPVRRVFEAPTVAGLSEILLADEHQRDRLLKTARILLRVSEMSEHEAREWLGNRTADEVMR